MSLSTATRSLRSGLSRKGSDLVDPLRERNVRLLWLAKISSEIGDWSARLALAYLVYERTGSAAATAAVTVVSLAPWLGLGQVLATLADRFPHRNVMVVTDIVRIFTFLLIAWLPLPLIPLFILVFVAASAAPPFEAARSACLPELVSKERYGKTLVLFNATFQTGLLLGYVAGGGLVALVGSSWALTVNAATFGLSTIFVLMMRSRTRAPQHDPATGTPEVSGSRMLRAAKAFTNDRLLRRAVVLLMLSAAPVMAIEGLVVVYAAETLGGGSTTAGVLSAVVAMGALIAVFLLPNSGTHTHLLRSGAVVSAALLVLSGTVLILAPGNLLAAVPLLLLGAASSLTVPLGAILGQRLPRDVRATAFSLAQGSLMAAQGLGALIAGLLAGQLGVGAAVALVALPGILMAGWVLLVAREEPEEDARTDVSPGEIIPTQKTPSEQLVDGNA